MNTENNPKNKDESSPPVLEKYVPPQKPYKGKWTVEERRRYARDRAREIALRRPILEQQQRRLQEEYDKCIVLLKSLQNDVTKGMATLQPERMAQIYTLIPCPPNTDSAPLIPTSL